MHSENSGCIPRTTKLFREQSPGFKIGPAHRGFVTKWSSLIGTVAKLTTSSYWRCISRTKQLAQLWQRNRAKLDTFSINVQRYSQNHEIALLGHSMGASGAIQALYIKVLMKRNFVAEFHRENASFTRKTAN